MEEKKGIRLAKLIARHGYCSRREAERLIVDGDVKVNGIVETNLARLVTDESIKIKNKLINPKEKTKLWLFNKPLGYLVTNTDPDNRKTIFEILPKNMPRVLSVGRLDMNTQGLLLLTNNGDLARYLELPSTGWTRQYRVKVHGFLTKLKASIPYLSKKGILIKNIKYAPINITIEQENTTNTWLKVSINEGKNREVRRILEHFGLKVTRLIRTAYGPFQLPKNMPVGAVKPIADKVLKSVIGNKIDLNS